MGLSERDAFGPEEMSMSGRDARGPMSMRMSGRDALGPGDEDELCAPLPAPALAATLPAGGAR